MASCLMLDPREGVHKSFESCCYRASKNICNVFFSMKKVRFINLKRLLQLKRTYQNMFSCIKIFSQNNIDQN